MGGVIRLMFYYLLIGVQDVVLLLFILMRWISVTLCDIGNTLWELLPSWCPIGRLFIGGNPFDANSKVIIINGNVHLLTCVAGV